MVVLNKLIYTKTGDKGDHRARNGFNPAVSRPKYDLRVEAYGTVDETNALYRDGAPAYGAERHRCRCDARTHPERPVSISAPISPRPIPARSWNDETGLRITQRAGRSPRERDRHAQRPPCSPLRSFVLPGGAPAAAALHSRAQRFAAAPSARSSNSPNRDDEAVLGCGDPVPQPLVRFSFRRVALCQ